MTFIPIKSVHAIILMMIVLVIVQLLWRDTITKATVRKQRL